LAVDAQTQLAALAAGATAIISPATNAPADRNTSPRAGMTNPP
jgi:hypothetical protein